MDDPTENKKRSSEIKFIEENEAYLRKVLEQMQDSDVLPESSDSSEFKRVCAICFYNGEESNKDLKFIECSTCLSDYHLSCLKPALNQIPKRKWICHECNNRKNKRQNCVICGGEGSKNFLRCAICPRAYHIRCNKKNVVYPIFENQPWYCNICYLEYLLGEKSLGDDEANKVPKDETPSTSSGIQGTKRMNVYCFNSGSESSLSEIGKVCEICLIKDDEKDEETLYVECKGCFNNFHKYCLKPVMTEDPKRDWYCNQCKNKRSNKKNCIVCGKPGYKCFLVCAKCPRSYHIRCLDKPTFCKVSKTQPWLCDGCFIRYSVIDDKDEKVCELCIRGEEDEGNGDKFLLCHGCRRDFHGFCLKPAIEQVPKRAWYCHICKNERSNKRNCIVCGGEGLKKILICAKCPRAYHRGCLRKPALCKVSKNKPWLCDDCFVRYKIVPEMSFEMSSATDSQRAPRQ